MAENPPIYPFHTMQFISGNDDELIVNYLFKSIPVIESLGKVNDARLCAAWI